MRKIIIVILSCFFMIGGVLFARADNVAVVGNMICPVMGNKIAEDGKATYEYKDKVYNFCCNGCIEEFKKNPEKYIKIIESKNINQPIKNK